MGKFNNYIRSALVDILGPTKSMTLGLRLVRAITFVVSILYLAGAVYKLGFYDITYNESMWLQRLETFTWFVFFVSLACSFVVDYEHSRGLVKAVSIAFASLYCLSALPVLFSRLTNPAVGVIWDVLGSRYYVSTLLMLYALVTVCKGFLGFINRKVNPALVFMVSFMIIIFIGMGLLLLPKSTVCDQHLSWIDALFVSTSAVSVTGLTPVDVSSVFTLQGQVIIMALIQIGGLGVMTFTCFFAMFFIGNTALSNQLVVKDMISSDSFASLFSILLNILVFTVVIELCGAVLLFCEIHDTMGLGWTTGDELFFALFHSVSAFCNAGFSTVSGNLGNPMLMHGHNMLYIIISLLVILGGIGFPILVNYKRLLSYKFHNWWRGVIHPLQPHLIRVHITNINTKLVVWWTFGLILFGAAVFAVFEWNGAFAGMTFGQKITHAFFNSVCTRTAGFNGVDLTALTLQSVLVYIVLMWIGGGAQSTAGGIKVNVFAVAVSNLVAIIRGKQRAEAFGREIALESIRKANATIIASVMILFVFIFTVSILDPGIPFGSIVFECVSAMGTVGSSLNTTPLLGSDSKLLISALMFIGRIGVITFLVSFIPQSKPAKYRLLKEDVIVN